MLREQEGPGGGCARPRGPSTPLAGHEPGLSEISSLSPAPPAACGPCRSCVLLWEFVTSQEASEVPGPAPLPAPVRRGCTARVLQGAPPPRPPAGLHPASCLPLRILQQETRPAAQRVALPVGPMGHQLRALRSPRGACRGAGPRLRLSTPPSSPGAALICPPHYLRPEHPSRAPGAGVRPGSVARARGAA